MVFTPLIAVAIELTVVPEANDNWVLPRLPATCRVTVLPLMLPPVIGQRRGFRRS